jgi:unsaturated chondroitin disaccharide hydrolase
MSEITDEIEAIIRKIDRNMELYGTRFPHLSATGIYSDQLTVDGSWTGSFWTGMVYLAYRYTRDSKYIDYLIEYLPVYDQRLQEGYIDHDVGFLYQLYAVVLYEATGDEKAKQLAVRAADKLLERYNSTGGFIRAWGELGDDDRRGTMIIDCLLNLPLLYSASELTGNPMYLKAADIHANSAMIHQIRTDGSTHHTFSFDPDTGTPIGGFNEGGYSDESAWSRGQAWGIYGFALAYRHTGKKEYAEATRHLTEYFIANLPEDLVPYWDFSLPSLSGAQKDASAAAIAACGILEMHRLLDGELEVWDLYRDKAIQILESLRSAYSSATDSRVEGILSRCFGKVNGIEYELYTIWGDYYYMEGLLMASGHHMDAWSIKS